MPNDNQLPEAAIEEPSRTPGVAPINVEVVSEAVTPVGRVRETSQPSRLDIEKDASAEPLALAEMQSMDAWLRAANYLSVGQVYLLANPLLREPLTATHVKPRLLGHFGTVPGLNFIYLHLNRVIKAQDLSVLFVAGPGHGAPGVIASTWLEGT